MELLTIRETAQVLKVAPLTIRRYIAEGRLPAVRVGKRVRVRREALDHFLAPVAAKPARRAASAARDRPTSAEDPLWNIVGIARSGGPGDVSESKHK